MSPRHHTARFNATPHISIRPRECVVVAPFKVIHSNGDRLTDYTIPAGFVSDGASIKPILRSIVSKYTATNAGIAHDYFYETAAVDRRTADKIFYLLLRQAEMNIISAKLAYYAVRAFGGFFYNKKETKK